MAKYTIELRNIIKYYGRETVESWFSSYDINDYLLPDQVEQLQKFPNIWSKEKLAKKIVDHYFMREIGFETPALFEHYAKVVMQEIMEEKLPLIYTTALTYDPLVNVDYTETFVRSEEQQAESSNEGLSNGSSLSINSDTPQGQISKEEILTGKYASNTGAGEDETHVQSSANGKNNTEETFTRNFKGNQGISATYQALIKQFRENIIAVDKDIINELNSLFMGLY